MSTPSKLGRVYAIYSHKGGVGKTTVTKELCDSFLIKKLDIKILLVDCDPQSNLTTTMFGNLPISAPNWSSKNLMNLLPKNPTPYKLKAGHPQIDMLTGDDEDEEYIQLMSNMFAKRSKSGAINIVEDKFMFLKTQYDVILVDMNPSLSVLNKTILFLSDFVVCPVLPDEYSLQGCVKLQHFMKTNQDLIGQFRNKVEILGFVLNQVGWRSNDMTSTGVLFKKRFEALGIRCLGILPSLSDTKLKSIKFNQIIMYGNNNDETISVYKRQMSKLSKRVLGEEPEDTPLEVKETDFSGSHHVYIIHEQTSSFYKIGKSSGPTQVDFTPRLADLQTGNPRVLETILVIPNLSARLAFSLENQLQSLFSRNNAHLREDGPEEWFEFNADHMILLETVIKSIDLIKMQICARLDR